MKLQISPLEQSILHSPKLPITIEGEITFTKTPKGYGYGEILFDRAVHIKALSSLEQVVSIKQLLERFQSGNIQNVELKLPRHYPVLIQNAKGVFNNSQNLFVYFPYCMKASFAPEYDSNFSLEFYERTTNIFNLILAPILGQVFYEPAPLIQTIQDDLSVNIWTFSMLHELSHHVGHWYMSPKTNPAIKVNGFLKGIFGELSSDLYSAVLVPERNASNLLNLLMKCFYYPRIGFLENRISGRLNTDNDAWEGILLLQRFLESGALFSIGNKIEIDQNQFLLDCKTLLNEVNTLGFEITQIKERIEQEKVVNEWMKKQLPHDGDNWILPKNIKSIFDSLISLPELIK